MAFTRDVDAAVESQNPNIKIPYNINRNKLKKADILLSFFLQICYESRIQPPDNSRRKEGVGFITHSFASLDTEKNLLKKNQDHHD